MTGLLERGLQADLDAEQIVLGSMLLDGDRYPDVVIMLTADAFTGKTSLNVRALQAAVDVDQHAFQRVEIKAAQAIAKRVVAKGPLGADPHLDCGNGESAGESAAGIG
ncbi:MAG TPA: DnaB-like helicase N-terminal domain-containing protein [Bryobacteraceae bacterium]|jgi:hypothetical protein|nr:DnaB-like helicase N-terminal domain-containing protein [Bryobacteraceae bacterium]